MGHNAAIRTPGSWTGDLLATELEVLDLRLAQAVNGDDGGVWAPLSQIVIGGAGIDVTGPTVFSELHSLTMSAPGSTLTVAGILSVLGTVTMASTGLVECYGAADFLSANFEVAALGEETFQAGSTLTFTAPTGSEFNSQWTGSPTFDSGFVGTFGNGSMLVFGDGTSLVTQGAVTQGSTHSAVFSCPVTLGAGGTITQVGPRVLSGPNAGIAWRQNATQAVASAYDCSQDSYAVPALQAACDFTIRHSGVGGSVVAQQGMVLSFVGVDGSATPTLKREDGSTIYAPGATPWWASLYFDGTAWKLLASIV